MSEEIIFSPSEFVAVFNQTLEVAYPSVVIEGELADFRIAKNRWLYFSLKDELASVDFFGSVYQLSGPLQDGLKVRAGGAPRLHNRYGFTVNLLSITPIGEGSLKKAAELLARKLAAEGLFAPQRKRPLPLVPQSIGLITAAGSAAAADFIKILNERWGGLEVRVYNAYVQGEQAPASLIAAIDFFNRAAKIPDVLVVTRGGGSADDLAAFNDERVVRAVAASRAPTLVAIGHEVDISLAELAADQRASTPSNAAQLLVPDKRQTLIQLERNRDSLRQALQANLSQTRRDLEQRQKHLTDQLFALLKTYKDQLAALKKLVDIFDPKSALRRGYAIISKAGKHISRSEQVRLGDNLGIELLDGTIDTTVTGKQ